MPKYRLKVKKIPLGYDIPLFEPKFPPLDNLRLDMIENKEKIKKNAPKPVFYRPPEEDVPKSVEKFTDDNEYNSDSDEILKQLEDTYEKTNSSIAGTTTSDDEENSEINFSTASAAPSTQPAPSVSSEPSAPERPYYIEKKEESEESSEKEAKEKADYLFKFMVLRRQYPNVEIPQFSDHSDLGTMKRVYENVIRRVSLDSSVINYKKFLVGGFMVCEWMSTNWLNIDIQGFTASQLKVQNQYDRLLLELGEKNYTPLGSRFPVEVRLLFMIFMNAGLFYVQKSVFSGKGLDIMGMLNSVGGGGSGGSEGTAKESTQGSPNPRSSGIRRKMRGPTISPEDIEKMARENENSDLSS